MPAIQATEAKRTFGAVLERVSEGETYTVMRHGKPVARIIPIDLPVINDQFGALSEYADPSKRALELEALTRAMENKHAAR